LNELTRRTIAADLKFKREKQAREKMIKEYLEEKRHLRDKVKAVMEAAEEQYAEEQFQAFHRRREMQLAELVVRMCNMMIVLYTFMILID
jgi:ribosomal protein L14E/L6E/L27E